MSFVAAAVAAVAVGGATAYTARQESKSAKSAAEAQRDWSTAQYADQKELEDLQLQQYKDINVPYQQSIYDLWKSYGQPQAEEKLKIYGEQGLPAQREMATQLRSDLTQPLQLPQDVWDKVWQQAREKTLAEYAPIEQRTSQRLASTGGLGQGPGQSLFADIEASKAKSIETLAINQAITEWTEKKAAKQLAYDNMFKSMGYAPTTNVPSTATSAIGTIQPYTAVPKTTSGVGEGIGAGINFLSSMYGGGMFEGSGAASSGGTTNTSSLEGYNLGGLKF